MKASKLPENEESKTHSRSPFQDMTNKIQTNEVNQKPFSNANGIQKYFKTKRQARIAAEMKFNKPKNAKVS